MRFYRWSSPTISLGYFQKIADFNQRELPLTLDEITQTSAGDDPARNKSPPVFTCSATAFRGGAILHDCEWTYSIAVPNSHSLSKTPLALYDIIHNVFIDMFDQLGARIKFRGETDQTMQSQYYAF